MARRTTPALGYDEFDAGDEWESQGRTVTEADITNFAGLSGDFNPLHVDHEFGRGTAFGGPVAHGLLGLAIASGLASHSPRVATLAFLGIVEWKFLRPIAPGDTVRVVTQVVAIEPRSRGRRAQVTWRRRLINQDGEVVQEGLTQTLVRSSAEPEGSGAE